MMKLLIFLSANLIAILLSGQTIQDEERVKQAVLAFQDDFNEGSFKNAYNYTTQDWEHINPFGGITKGRDSTLADVRYVHQKFLKGVTMKVESMDIRFIAPNAAIAVVVHKVDNYTTPDGVQHNNEQHRKTYVLVKRKNKWLLTLDHNTIMSD